MTALKNSKAPRFTPAGVIIEGDEAHICLLADDGWPHYTSVPADDPARWRRAIATLADPNTPTLGRQKRLSLRKPVWMGIECANPDDVPANIMALVLLPRGRLSVVSTEELNDYCDRLGLPGDCRFDRAELLANYVLRKRPKAADELLRDAAADIGLSGARARARL